MRQTTSSSKKLNLAPGWNNPLKFRWLTFFLLTLVGFTGCKSRKYTAIAYNPSSDSLPAKGVMLQQFHEKTILFKEISVNGRLEANMNGSENSMQFVLRMKQDSVIWLSLKPLLGIEAARIVITRDSVFIADRLNHLLYKRNLQYLQKFIGTPVPFQLLQDVLLSNMSEVLNYKPKIEPDSNFYLLSKDTNQLQYKAWVTPDFNKISHLRIIQPGSNRILEVFYPFFQDLQGKQFEKATSPTALYPKILNATFSDAANTSNLSIEFGPFKMEEEQNYSLSASKRYKLVEE